LYINSSGYPVFYHDEETHEVQVVSTNALSATTWTTVCASWSVAENEIAVKVGANAWETDIDPTTVTAFSAEPANVRLGEENVGLAVSDNYWADNFYTLTTYSP
jgi:hypothetical protein